MKHVFIALALALSANATNVPLRINAGGGDVEEWLAGSAFIRGGADYSFDGIHDISKVKDPAPAAVYTTVRHQNHHYEIPGLNAGDYFLRLHFTEGFETDSRAMDYAINGQKVIDGLNVFAAAGGTRRALVIEIPFTLKKGESLKIEANEDGGTDVFEAGLEILPMEKGRALSNPWSEKKAPVTQDNAAELRTFAGGPARFVWLRSDKFSHYTKDKSSVQLMVRDTEDPQGERPLIPDKGAWSKPVFTIDGQRIVFTDLASDEIFVIGFDGKNRASLGKGHASDAWRDPATGEDWVYLRSGGSGTKSRIVRRPLSSPTKEEAVWDLTENGHNGVPWFRLSQDGRHFADAFPWSRCGIGDLSGKKPAWKEYARGCWPSISPDNSYRAFVFNGSHSDIHIFDAGRKNKRTISLADIPGMKGKKVYFPRWSNHPRFLTVTGPEDSSSADLWLGKFSMNFQKIDAWARITQSSQAALFGDAWLASSPVK